MVTLDRVRDALSDFPATRLPDLAKTPRAAVAAIMWSGAADTELLLIHRAEDPNDPWSGHMAFPGGRVDPGETLREAAMREVREEVGLELEQVGREIGRLSDVAAVGRGRPLPLVIVPFVYELDAAPVLRPNREVAEIVRVPLGFLLDRSNRSTMEWSRGGAAATLPCYRYQGKLIWGLTFGMVDELVDCLDPPSRVRRSSAPRWL